MASIRIGTSGWRYAPWRGTFYPAGLPHRCELEYLASRLNTVEINGSFYSLQRPESWGAWYAQTPPTFLFAVKGPRFITHMKRLRDVETPLANFFASGIFHLRDKLGPILWQFPPQFRFDAERMRAFFERLPQDTSSALRLARKRDERMKGRVRLAIDANRPLRYAVEIRHESFLDATFVQLLRECGIALVIAETAQRWPLVEDVTADFLYLRLHGDKTLYQSGYEDAALERWARRIQLWRRGSEPKDALKIVGRKAPSTGPRDVFVYFDNTDVKLRAPFDAMTLMRKLGLTQERSDRRPTRRPAALRSGASEVR
jgi:uncharacterized protein YecE (DUF72 family)